MSVMAVNSADWRGRAYCVGLEPEVLFPDDPTDNSAAKMYCHRCPVRDECLNWALESDSREGTWGGLTEFERARLHADYANGLSEVLPEPAGRFPRSMTAHERIELVDLIQECGQAARRKYRLRLGELYMNGVSIRQLLDSGVSNDRLIWRSIREYRAYRGISVPERPPRRTRPVLPGKVQAAVCNYRELAQLAPTEAAREFWRVLADELEQGKALLQPVSAL